MLFRSFTLSTLPPLSSLSSLSTLCSLYALDALLALCSLRALETLCALSALGSLNALDTLLALSTLSTLLALSSLRALETLSTLSANSASEVDGPRAVVAADSLGLLNVTGQSRTGVRRDDQDHVITLIVGRDELLSYAVGEARVDGEADGVSRSNDREAVGA